MNVKYIKLLKKSIALSSSRTDLPVIQEDALWRYLSRLKSILHDYKKLPSSISPETKCVVARTALEASYKILAIVDQNKGLKNAIRIIHHDLKGDLTKVNKMLEDDDAIEQIKKTPSLLDKCNSYKTDTLNDISELEQEHSQLVTEREFKANFNTFEQAKAAKSTHSYRFFEEFCGA